MRRSPMPKPISSKFSSPTIAETIGMITPLMKASTIDLKYNAITKPTATVMTLPWLMKSLYSPNSFFMDSRVLSLGGCRAGD